jgi:hypothetical protein
MGIKRDLSGVKPPEVVFDDRCGLQEYFDALAASSALAPPAEVSGQGVGTNSDGEALGGTARFVFASEFQIHYLRRLLDENWKRVPPALMSAERVELEVRWSQKAGVRRVVTTEGASIATADDSWYLPYHVCLSDLLFGEDLYKTRRAFLQLPPAKPSRFIKPGAASAVASVNGAVDGGAPDGGVTAAAATDAGGGAGAGAAASPSASPSNGASAAPATEMAR